MQRWKGFALVSLLGIALSGPENARGQEGDYLMPAIPAFRTSALKVQPRLELDTKELPRVPGQLPVFEILAAPPADVTLRRIAEPLGFRVDATRSARGRLSLREHPEDTALARSLTLFEASGGFVYAYERLYSPPERQPELPSEKEAHQKALQFLREQDLLPPDALVDYERASFSRSVLTEFDATKNRKLRELVASIEVRFPQAWEGYLVTGPGSKLYVALGEEGRVLGVTRMWREARVSDASLPSVPLEEAIQLLRDGKGRSAYPADCARAAARNVELAYWSESPRLTQRVSLPVYRIRGECTSEKGDELGRFEAYAPAVRNRSFRIEQRPSEEVDDEPYAEVDR